MKSQLRLLSYALIMSASIVTFACGQIGSSTAPVFEKTQRPLTPEDLNAAENNAMLQDTLSSNIETSFQHTIKLEELPPSAESKKEVGARPDFLDH